MIKIFAVGDFHGKFPKKLKNEAKKCDLILSTGDYGGSDKLLKVVFKYFYTGWWKEVGDKLAKEYVMEDYNSGKKILQELNKLKIPVYTIHGNWDFENTKKKQRTAGLKLQKYSEIIKSLNNIFFINKRIFNTGKIKLSGFGGNVTPLVYLSKSGGHSKRKRESYKRRYLKEEAQLFRTFKKRKDIDIFLAHYPPEGYFDVVNFKGENPMNGKHVGFKPYTNYIKKYQPELFICGHMHEYQGMKKLGNTLIVATGSAKEGKAVIIDFDEKIKKVKRVRFIK